MFEKPKPGSTVTFTTIHHRGLPLETTRTEHDVRVVKSARWDNPNTFRIKRNTKFNPDGVVELGNVQELYIDGWPAKNSEQQDQTEKITVKGNKGKQYTVTVENGEPKACTCTGFMYRGTCRHLSEAMEIRE